MTRHDERDGIGRARARHGAHGRWLANRPRDLRVGPRLAARNLRERAPHAPLKRRAANVHGHVRGHRRRVRNRERRVDERLRAPATAVAAISAAREFVAQEPQQVARPTAPSSHEAQPARRSPPRACGRSRSRRSSQSNRRALAAAPVRRRRHARQADRAVHAARRSVAGFVDRVGHAMAVAQRHRGTGAGGTPRRSRAAPGRARDETRAAAATTLVPPARASAALVQRASGRRATASHARRTRSAGDDPRRRLRVRMAPPTRRDTRAASAIAERRKELDAIATRPAARTGRTAVDAGRLHGVDEQAVGARVAATPRRAKDRRCVVIVPA